MDVVVLGSAAGGGVPQWNCNHGPCRRSRTNDPACPPRTQAGIAVSSDGDRWVLIGAAPEMPQQLRATPELQPRPGERRASPVAAVVLLGADIDAIAGLLSLRERQAFDVIATAKVHGVLEANPVFEVLARDVVRRRAVRLDEPILLADLTVELFAVPGKPPLWREGVDGIAHGEDETTAGAIVRHGAARLAYVPSCAAVTPGLATRLGGVDLLFFDGTLWRDDEMSLAGAGEKTGARMGHMNLSGAEGTLAAFESIAVGRKMLIHLNHTNPAIAEDTPERAEVGRHGWEVAFDGQRLSLSP